MKYTVLQKLNIRFIMHEPFLASMINLINNGQTDRDFSSHRIFTENHKHDGDTLLELAGVAAQ